MKNKYLITLLLILISFSLTGCNKKKSGDEPGSTGQISDTSKSSDAKDSQAVSESSQPEKKDGALNTPAIPDDTTVNNSLAKRMTGKYSCFIPSDSSESEDGEYLIMNVITFGNNLYAFCGHAMEDDYESLEAYSFWACEFIPEVPAEMADTENNSVTVRALNFSIMSNAGKYWDSGSDGTITLTDQGLKFENFDNDGFLVPEHSADRLFYKDERVEDVFTYIGDNTQETELEGLWMLDTGSVGTDEQSMNADTDGADTDDVVPVYLMFDKGNLYIYKKAPDKEVFYAAGAFGAENGTLKGTASILGSGSMPSEFNADYELYNDELTISMEGDFDLPELSHRAVLRHINESDIHVTAIDELKFNDDSFGYYESSYDNRYESGFYGVWISGVKDRDKAIEDANALNNAAFDSYVCYTPEWEEMNQDEYYCVTSGRYTTKEEAEAELEAVKSAGYGDAYIKFTGGHKYTMVDYTNYGDLEMDVNDDRVILRDVRYVISRAWYEGMEDEEYVSDLVIDKQTVFDKKCEMEFFGNYNEGDDPFKWFVTNYDLMERNSDLYISNGPALSGIFEVGLTGNHIDRYFGSYWWD